MSWADDRFTRGFGMYPSFSSSSKEWIPQGEDERAVFDFLSMPLFDSGAVLDRFSHLPGAIIRADRVFQKNRFVYIPGSRKDRAVLVAHADTVFDWEYDGTLFERVLYRDGDIVHAQGLPVGADDRAGCAILWQLRNSGHSLLVVDGEELGCIGSRWLMGDHPDIADEINCHTFMIEFDRCNGTDFKTYDVGTEVFKQYVAGATGYENAGADSFTDICELCRDICGVNLSVGYYDPHSFDEHLNLQEWKKTLSIARNLLSQKLSQFRR